MNRYLLKIMCLSSLIMPTSPASNAAEQNYSIDWFTIDGGGEIKTQGGVWELSGTVGQWDVDQAAPHNGGSWELIGGFWGVTVTESEELFRDSFEG